MRSWMIAFSLGIIVAGLIPSIPPSEFLFALASVIVLALVLLCFKACRYRAVLSIIFFYLGGALWCLLTASHIRNNWLPRQLENQDIWLSGQIISLVQESQRSQRFLFSTRKLCYTDDLSQCDWREEKKLFQLNLYENVPVATGEHWQLKVRLKRPRGFANPGGFDYEGWLFQQKIHGTGYIRADPDNSILSSTSNCCLFNRLRQQIRSKLSALALSHEGLIRALSIGDRYGISPQQWDIFTGTGTNHLMVISGLHVGLVSTLFYVMGNLLMRCNTKLLLKIPAQQGAAVSALGGAFVYAGLAGFSLPAQRAMLMVLVALGSKLLLREITPLHALGLALVSILMLDPLAPQNSGFWLSFCAVGVLLMFVSRQQVTTDEISPQLVTRNSFAALLQYGLALVQTQLLLFIGLLPVMLFFFQQVSSSAPLVNMLAIPAIGLVVVPLCLLGIPLLWLWPAAATKVYGLSNQLLMWFEQALLRVSQLDYLQLVLLPALHLWQFLFLIMCLGAFLIIRKASVRILLALLATGTLLLPPEQLPAGNVSIVFVDVGQGLAVSVSTANHHLLYDSGPAFSERFNAGADVVIPVLRKQNIRRLDKVIISHADSDHAGGTGSIELAYPEAEYSAPDTDIFSYARQQGECRKGQQWYWDTVQFEILHPDDNQYSRNNSSCVLKITTGEYSVLLTGDIERQVELQLLNNPTVLNSAILLAPHHGSKTSSSYPFIQATAPRYVIFSSGYLNRFNHPHPDVQANYRQAGSILLNTADSGAISVRLSAEQGIEQISEFRQDNPRIWR